jgi:hypothetical protein
VPVPRKLLEYVPASALASPFGQQTTFNKQVLDFIGRLGEDERVFSEKVIIVGNSTVGKTSLSVRNCLNEFTGNYKVPPSPP